MLDGVCFLNQPTVKVCTRSEPPRKSYADQDQQQGATAKVYRPLTSSLSERLGSIDQRAMRPPLCSYVRALHGQAKGSLGNNCVVRKAAI